MYSTDIQLIAGHINIDHPGTCGISDKHHFICINEDFIIDSFARTVYYEGLIIIKPVSAPG
jgi:hypothetical protein